MKYETICLPERQQDRNILNIDTKENRLRRRNINLQKKIGVFIYTI